MRRKRTVPEMHPEAPGWPSIASASSRLCRDQLGSPRAWHESATFLKLGMVSVLGDIAAVSGSVKGEGGATAELEINGQHVAIEVSGIFSAVVKLDGEPELRLWLATEAGERITMVVPVRATAVRVDGFRSSTRSRARELRLVSVAEPDAV
jgi:hypothetical protein